MNPSLNSILALAFLFLGAAAVFLMLELKGNPKDRVINKRLILAHRIFGYLFVAIYLFMLILMIKKTAAFQEEFSARAVFHIVLAIAIIPLLAIKLLIVRRHKRLTSELLGFGIAIFLFAFVLNGVTAGYYFLNSSDLRYTTLSDYDEDMLDEAIGREIIFKKCGKCHTLEKVFRQFKSREGWTANVNRMALIDAPNISDFDVKQIIYYLEKQQGVRTKSDAGKVDAEIGKTLVSTKCSSCHNLDQVFGAAKTVDEWSATVDEMAGYSGDPKFLTDEEKSTIIEFLSGRK
jgi:mono/diheme cytochrome c family protein/uncharacterized membrane protein YozB (DUF420 family)